MLFGVVDGTAVGVELDLLAVGVEGKGDRAAGDGAAEADSLFTPDVADFEPTMLTEHMTSHTREESRCNTTLTFRVISRAYGALPFLDNSLGKLGYLLVRIAPLFTDGNADFRFLCTGQTSVSCAYTQVRQQPE
jgi:hypothetical protein